MPSAEIEVLLAPIAPENPCGADLEYGDPGFAELERSVQGKPEQQIGNTVVPAADPDWKAVERQATQLLRRTKDLRASVHLTNALLHTRGLKGLTDGIGLLDKLVESYWEGLHPRLDPDDGHDPTMRVNILASLAAPPVLAAVRATPMVVSRTLGTFALKDIETAVEGGGAGGNGEKAASTVIAAAMDCDLVSLQETVATTRDCMQQLAALETAVSARVDAAHAPSFGKLAALLHMADSFLGGKLAERTPGAAVGANGEAATGSPGAASVSGQINSREDVIRALDRIAAYYTRHEPSSPIPLFMERCKKMVMMSFVDIVKELVPDALSQVEVLKGRSE
jgi:type VI secretion system protein ImpA